MEEQQAEAIAQAILEPDLSVQAELRRKREAEERGLVVRRVIATFVLVGFAIGAATALAVGERFTVGGLWGGLVVPQLGGPWVLGVIGETRPNNAFKPKPLRYAKHMAGKACQVLCSTTRLGLT